MNLKNESSKVAFEGEDHMGEVSKNLVEKIQLFNSGLLEQGYFLV